MKVLVACEESQRVCIAFRERGHEAYSCDIQDPSGGHPEWHIKDDVLKVINDGWDLIIAHPPCTYLSLAGASHLYMKSELIQRGKDFFKLMNEQRIKDGIKARDFFFAMLNAKCDHIAVENPKPCSLWCLPPPTQEIQPFEFGEPYTKRTFLWLKGLEPLQPTNIVEPKAHWVSGDNRSGGLKRSAKERSKTFAGIANAMAEQWGGLET